MRSSVFTKENLYDECKLSWSIIEKWRAKVDVGSRARIGTPLGSVGNQRKWRTGDKIVKLNCLGYEDIAEVCVGWLLKHCQLEHDWVMQFPCNVCEDGVFLGRGVIADDYLQGEEEITFAEVLRENLESFTIEYEEIIDLIQEECGVNARSYVDLKTCVDAMVRNEDSHWGNFALVGGRPAPLFDFGDACMADCISYPIDADFDACFEKLQAKPFRTNFEDQINPFCKRVGLNYSAFYNSIQTGESAEFDRAIKTILQGLERSRNIAWEEL